VSDKNFDNYVEQLAPERGKYHIVEGGNLYLVNFDVNSPQLRPEHGPIIDRLVVPFMVKAVKHLGPGRYNLNVIGSASATGTDELNLTLGKNRADNAAMYAIQKFEAIQKADPTLDRVQIKANTDSIGREIAKKEAGLLHLNTRQRIERSQAHFRAVLFRFAAGLSHPGSGSTFYIREIFYFKFQKISEPMPAVLRKIDDWLDNPVIKFAADQAISRALKPLMEKIGPLGVIAQHMVSFMIPRTADYCFEIKDYRGSHALYRFHGVEHKDSLGIAEVFSFFSAIHGVLKVLSYAAKLPEGLQKAVDGLAKQTDETMAKYLGYVRKYAGDAVADTATDVLNRIKQGTLLDALEVPASAWNPFQFHDRSPKHNVSTLAGPARRNVVDLGMHSAVDMEFGGYVPNSWSDYNAEARYRIPFSLRNGLVGIAGGQGVFILLRGSYVSDASPGLLQPITG
jgi:hypothetical protein